jgi:type II secretory pathway pseudopilin PulG
MHAFVRAATRNRRSQSGQSMVEITATLMLLSIVLTFVYASIDSAQRSIVGESERIGNLSEAQTLMDAITKDLRTATRLQAGNAPFVAANDRDVTFYANLNNATGGPRKIRIYVDPSSEIISAVWSPDSGSISPNYTYTGTSALRYVGRYVVNTAAQPIFEYYDINGVKLPSPLSGPSLLAAYSVKITLIVRKQTVLPVRSITLVNQVRLPNVDYQPTS